VALYWVGRFFSQTVSHARQLLAKLGRRIDGWKSVLLAAFLVWFGMVGRRRLGFHCLEEIIVRKILLTLLLALRLRRFHVWLSRGRRGRI